MNGLADSPGAAVPEDALEGVAGGKTEAGNLVFQHDKKPAVNGTLYSEQETAKGCGLIYEEEAGDDGTTVINGIPFNGVPKLC